MSKRARAMVASVGGTQESPSQSGGVPAWFNSMVDQTCDAVNNESEPPVKKKACCRNLNFSPSKQSQNNSKIVDADETHNVDNSGSDSLESKTADTNHLPVDTTENFLGPVSPKGLAVATEDDQPINSTVIEPIYSKVIEPINSSVIEMTNATQDTDGDFLAVSTTVGNFTDSTSGSIVNLTNMSTYSHDFFHDENSNLIPEVDHSAASDGEPYMPPSPFPDSDESRDNCLDESAEGETAEGHNLITTAQGVVTPSNNSGHERRVDAPQKPARKRVAKPVGWKNNIRKDALNSGKSHTSTSGKEKKARELRPGCPSTCHRCQRRLTLEEREEIRKNFWDIGNHQRQLDYVLSRIKSSTPKKKYCEPGKPGKQTVRTYYLQINSKDVRVCKTMFMDTLVICDSWVKTATNHSRGEVGVAPIDQRGRHKSASGSKVVVDLKSSVREHINLIPRVESHYTRSRSKREYVENGLSIEELYRRYVLWVAEKNLPKIASIRTYRKIFNEEFNIGFFKPKKDQCALCSKWKHSTTQEKAKMAHEYAKHTENRNISQRLKESDKIHAEKEENMGTICVASFDLQKILTCPKSEVSDFYYKSKLKLYNFTIFDMVPRLGTCYMWNETEGNKGSAEVASGVYHFIDKKQKEGVKELIFYSDNPTSQNKNRFIFPMYLLASTKYNLKITHRFLEVGHTHMEVDSMHAAIEKSVSKKEIFNIEEWYTHILDAKKNGKNRNDPAVKYTIEKVGKTYEILNFKPLAEKQNWDVDTSKNKVQWMKIREAHFNPEKSGIVSLKYDYNSNPIEVNVKDKRGRPVNMTTYIPCKKYNDRLPLPALKIKHLMELMKDEAIPTKYHPFYQDLLDIGIAPPENTTQCPDDCFDCDEHNQEESEV